MKVTILSYTPEPEKTVAAAARLCYSKISAARIKENLSDEKAASLIKKLMALGHMSPAEHASFTFAIDGVSRTLLAQITRHRIASYSVQSLRYNNPFDEEISKTSSESELTAENLSYLEGLAASCKLSGQKSDFMDPLMQKYSADGRMPDEIENLHLPSYMRGVFDCSGALLNAPDFEISFSPKLYSVFKAFPFNTTQSGEKILIKGEDALSFVKYIYESVDFADSFYDRDKLVALCSKSPDLDKYFLSSVKDFISTKYYCTVPKSISENLRAMLVYLKGLDSCKKSYIEMIKLGIHREDARYILPNGTQTRIVMTMNVRSLYNFFNLRCCERAQTEIRQLANLMLSEVKKIAPGLFEKAGAPCKQLGYCPEGEFSCGKYPPADKQ